jgi:hypothetical protein
MVRKLWQEAQAMEYGADIRGMSVREKGEHVEMHGNVFVYYPTS